MIPHTKALYCLSPGYDNSGVFVGYGVNTVITQGEEVQIDSTDDPDSTTGAIYNEQAADAAAPAGPDESSRWGRGGGGELRQTANPTTGIRRRVPKGLTGPGVRT